FVALRTDHGAAKSDQHADQSHGYAEKFVAASDSAAVLVTVLAMRGVLCVFQCGMRGQDPELSQSKEGDAKRDETQLNSGKQTAGPGSVVAIRLAASRPV